VTEGTIVIWAYIGYCSLFLGLIPLPVIVTIGFRYVTIIEDRVAADAGGIATARMFWQGRVVGRFCQKQQCIRLSSTAKFSGFIFQAKSSSAWRPGCSFAGTLASLGNDAYALALRYGC